MSELHSSLQFVEIEKLRDQNVDLSMLAYPSKNPEEVENRVAMLLKQGVVKLAVKVRNGYELFMLGKGVRGIVFLGLVNDSISAVKLMRSDSPVKDLGKEAGMQVIANSLGVGPKLISWSKEMILMEYVEGIKLGSIITTCNDYLKLVVERVLEQCYTLDINHFDHGQLTNSSDHVIVTKNNVPYIIDFSHSSTLRKPANVTSFISYLLRTRLKKVDNIGLFQLLRDYKKDFSRAVFDKLKQFMLYY